MARRVARALSHLGHAAPVLAVAAGRASHVGAGIGRRRVDSEFEVVFRLSADALELDEVGRLRLGVPSQIVSNDVRLDGLTRIFAGVDVIDGHLSRQSMLALEWVPNANDELGAARFDRGHGLPVDEIAPADVELVVNGQIFWDDARGRSRVIGVTVRRSAGHEAQGQT